MLECDLNGNLREVIQAIAYEPVSFRNGVRFYLHNRLDDRSRAILHEQFVASAGEELAFCCAVLQSVADAETLRLTRQRLCGRETSAAERPALIMLLGAAARRAGDSTAAACVATFVGSNDRDIMITCVLALSIIPGEEASMLLDGLSRHPDADVARNAKTMLGLRSPTDPGN